MKANASGQLRHQFFGTYSAVIGLVFDDEYSATQALPKLGSNWKLADKNKKALIWVGNSEELKSCKTVLGSFGADIKKIDSIAKSIDFGEPFSIAVEIIPKEQLSFQGL